MSDKSNAVTDDEFVEADELLASIPVEAEAMDLAEADGFMTAVQLLPKTPETKDWLPHILSTIGAKDAGTGSAASDKRLRALLLKRFHQIGDQLTQAVPLDPVYFEAEDEKGRPLTGKAAIEALEPFALGFLEAAQTWPGIFPKKHWVTSLRSRPSSIKRLHWKTCPRPYPIWSAAWRKSLMKPKATTCRN